MVTASQAIFPAPPASGSDLVDRHWAVAAMPAAERLATLAAAGATGLITDPVVRVSAHTLATAYELAALLGRDALRSGSSTSTAALERDALRIGAERAALLHRALGLPWDITVEGALRHALRVTALAAVAGPGSIAQTRAWLQSEPQTQRPEHAGHESEERSAESRVDPVTELWTIWRRLLLHPDATTLEHLISQLAMLREQRSGEPDLSPSTNEAELRLRFRRFVRERLADAAGLLAIGLRGRTDPLAIAAALTAQCTAARSASTGDPNLDLLAAWLELAALTALGPRISAAR